MKKLNVFCGAAVLGAMALGLGSGCSGDSSSKDKAATDGSSKNAEAPISGALAIDGSTTVYPIVSAATEDFVKANPDVKATVSKAGTGSGFKKFERGEIDIAAASRPIKDTEEAALKAKGIEYIEIPIAYDGVSIIVSKSNTTFDKTTVEELKKAWSEGSTVKTWADLRAGLPAAKMAFYGPTENHGTYEYFTEAVNGKKNSIRKDTQLNQEYTAIVNSVAGDKNGIAYVGYNYYAENKDKVTAVAVGGILPTEATIADGTYTPLSRPLFIYVNKKAMADKPAVKGFVQYLMSEKGDGAVKEAKYVILPPETRAAIKAHVDAQETGSKFGKFKPGDKMGDLYKK